MQPALEKYPIRNPLLAKYIRFFWMLRADRMRYDHAVTPQRNINLKFNVGGADLFARDEGGTAETRVGTAFFTGLHDRRSSMRITGGGAADIVGVSFFPYGFYPFLGVPMKDFRNALVDTDAAGFRAGSRIAEKLAAAPDAATRLQLLEDEFAALLEKGKRIPDDAWALFTNRCGSDIGLRRRERMFDKYVGVSMTGYALLDRFHAGLKQLLAADYARLSDIAYDNGYFDQTHYIRNFKRFSGQSPSRFAAQGNTLMRIGRFAER
jgi:methylphosphotriester-DNA--protein-cysteine methyltransferase